MDSLSRAAKADPRSALAIQAMPGDMVEAVNASADSTHALMIDVAKSVDAAAMHAMFALQPTITTKQAVPMIRTARSSAIDARAAADASIQQGDRLSASVSSMPSAANRPWNQSEQYKHYWVLARKELMVARSEAARAVLAADKALACRTAACTRENIALLEANSARSATATHRAEPLVRIALSFATSRYASGM